MSREPRLAGSILHLVGEAGRLGYDRIAPRCEVPRTVEAVDAAVLGRVLGRRIDTATVIATTSGTTDRRRYALTGDDVPASVFVKASPRATAQRLFGNVAGLGALEVGFYRDLRAHVPVVAPTAHGLAYHRRSGRYLVVLEDLAARGATFVDVLSDVDATTVAGGLENLARLHGTLWGRPDHDRGLAWITSASRDPVVGLLASAVPRLTRRLERTVPALVPPSGRSILAHYPAVLRRLDRAPHTVLHGDPHPGNLYLLDGTVGLLDWQVLRRGDALRDVTYLLVLALGDTERRADQRALVAHYLDALVASGGPRLHHDDAWASIRRHAAYAYLAAAFTTAIGGLQAEAVGTEGLRRAAVAIEEFDTAEALDLPALR